MKFKKGDKCKVVKNVLAPKCVGMVVTVFATIGNNGYKVRYDNGRTGIASENCLELFKE